MKKTLLPMKCIFAFTLLMAAYSCKKDLIVKSPAENSKISTDAVTDSNFVTLPEATSIALQSPTSSLVGNVMKTKQVDATLTGTKQIRDFIQYPNAETTSLYIFNFSGGGFVIVPSDKRIRPIIAFSNTGHFSLLANMPVGLTNWLSLNHKNMQVLRRNLTLARPQNMTLAWSQFTGINLSGSSKTSFKALPPPPPCEPGTTNYQVGPLLKTTWAQGVPYNQDTRMMAGAYSGGKAPTGCVATAMAQVMYYWSYPSSYNWAIMPINSDTYTLAGETEVSRLMYDVGASVGMSWGSTSSGAYASNTPNGLRNTFHYSSASFANWNSTSSYMTVQNNINANEPVILNGVASGEGHEWVCDGYLESTTTFCPAINGEQGITYLFFDMNWGWNEQGVAATDNVDGWYGYDEWDVYNGPDYEQFNSQLGFTYNIHP